MHPHARQSCLVSQKWIIANPKNTCAWLMPGSEGNQTCLGCQGSGGEGVGEVDWVGGRAYVEDGQVEEEAHAMQANCQNVFQLADHRAGVLESEGQVLASLVCCHHRISHILQHAIHSHSRLVLWVLSSSVSVKQIVIGDSVTVNSYLSS